MKKFTLLLFLITIFALSGYTQQRSGSATIEGYVLDSENEPIGETEIEIEQIGGTHSYDTTTDNEGYYKYDVWASSNIDAAYKIIAEKDGYLPDSVIVPNVSNEDIIQANTLFLKKIAFLGGKITIEEGAGMLEDVQVYLKKGDELIKTIIPSDDGTYLFDSITPEIYKITTELSGYFSIPEMWEVSTVDSVPGAINDTLNFTMFPLAILDGFVKNEGNVVVENATVIVGENQVITGEDGKYRIEDLPVDIPLTVTINAEGYYPLEEELTLESGMNEHDFELEFRPIVWVIPQQGFDFGEIEIGYVSESDHFQVHGIHLNGNVLVNSPDGFEISIDDNDFSSNITIEQGNFGFVNEKVYIRFAPDNEGAYAENVVISSEGAETVTFPVSGTGIPVEQLNANIIANPSHPVCPGENVTLKAIVSPVSDNYTYRWKMGQFILPDITSEIEVTPGITSVYTLIVKDKDNQELSDTATITVEVYENNLTVEHSPQDTAACANARAGFTVKIVPAYAGIKYCWQIKEETAWSDLTNNEIYSGVSTPNLSVQTVDSLNNTLYRCSYYRFCPALKEYTSSAELTVHPSPIDTIVIKGDSTVVVLISPDSGMVYQWYIDGTELQNQTGQYYYPGQNGFEQGVYTVKVTNKFGCSSLSKNPYIQEKTQTKSIRIYPNPILNKLYIDAENFQNGTTATLTIRNLQGRPLKISSIHLDEKNILSVDKLTSGTYIIEVSNDSGSLFYSFKMVKN